MFIQVSFCLKICTILKVTLLTALSPLLHFPVFDALYYFNDCLTYITVMVNGSHTL